MNTKTAFWLAALMVSPILAETSACATTDLTLIPGGEFALDASHAKIIFSTTHFGFSTYYGLFTNFDAKLNFDTSVPAKSTLDVTIHLDGIDTTNAKLDEHLKSADFFDVAHFPVATFKATKVEVTGPAVGKITGDLTLHGVTKPITLETSFNGGGLNPMSKAYVVGFNATGTIKRSDFGIKTYVPAVGDDVNLIISAEFDRVQ